jgi:organic anion transporter 5A
MDGWMDEWMDGWMDGWMVGWMNEWVGGRTECCAFDWCSKLSKLTWMFMKFDSRYIKSCSCLDEQ